MKWQWHWGALALVILLGAGLRVWGIDFGLPYTAAPDEPTHFRIALRIFQTGNLNPGWLNYPSLMFYINALALVPFYWVGNWLGVFTSPLDLTLPEVVTMGVGLLAIPAEFLYVRWVTAAFGVASLGVMYHLGRKLTGNAWGGVIAALLLAVSPGAVYNSHMFRPDSYAVFFALLSTLFALRLLDDPRLRNYIWAGIAAGCAVSSKYNLPLIVAPIIAAHFLRAGGIAGFKRKEIYFAGVASILGFLLTTPYVVLDFPLFMRGFGYEIFAQAEGHAGFEGNTLPWYLWYVWAMEGGLAILALAQAARLVIARSKIGLTLLAFPVVYFIFINQFIVRNDRTILPLLPFLHLLAAMAVIDLAAAVTRLHSRGLGVVSAALTCGVMVWLPLQTSIADDLRWTARDSRDTAREWIAANLPSGARVAQEAYTPYVDTRRFVVQGVYAIVDHPPEWYVQNGFEYLVFSQGMNARFLADPERYGQWADQYTRFFQTFPEVKQFTDGGYEIRIYETHAPLPAQRVAARFGNDGEIIELVGYDAPRWLAGEPLRITLHWRALSAKPEPLQVRVQLFDANDREIVSSQDDLFQGKGWRQGIFASDLVLPMPANLAPGAYRLAVQVIWMRFNYELPAKDWPDRPRDPVMLAPLEHLPR